MPIVQKGGENKTETNKQTGIEVNEVKHLEMSFEMAVGSRRWDETTINVIIYISLSSIRKSNQIPAHRNRAGDRRSGSKSVWDSIVGNCVRFINTNNCHVWINSIKMRVAHGISTCVDAKIQRKYTIDFMPELRVNKWAIDFKNSKESKRANEREKQRRKNVTKKIDSEMN